MPRDASCLLVASFVALIVQYLERSFFYRASFARQMTHDIDIANLSVRLSDRLSVRPLRSGVR